MTTIHVDTRYFEYQQNQEQPGINFPWLKADGTALDLSANYTIRCDVYDRSGTRILNKTTGVAGYNGGVTVDWAAGELNLAPDIYYMMIVARDVLSKDRVYSPGQLPVLTIVGPGVTP